jgi:hypothetical protein
MKFLNSAEARKHCPNLDTTATMQVADYECLVAETAYAKIDFVKCQLVRVAGHECPQRFGAGWVAKRKDGVQVYIGGDCADKNFRAAGDEGKRYRADARALELANRIEGLRARIAARKENAEFVTGLAETYQRCEALEDRARAECDALPAEVLSRLFSMLRTMRREVPGEVRYVEKEEDPSDSSKTIDVVRWRPTSLGVLQGLEGLNSGRLASLKTTVRDARNALRRVVSDEKRLEATLKNQIAAIEGADSVPQTLDAFERSLSSFRELDNYRTLSWLAVRDDEREKVVERYLKLAGRPTSLQAVRNLIGVWRRDIEERHGGKQFRARRDSY